MSLYKRGLGVQTHVGAEASAPSVTDEMGVGTALSLGAVGLVVVALLSKSKGGGHTSYRPPVRKFNIGSARTRKGMGGDMRVALARAEYDI